MKIPIRSFLASLLLVVFGLESAQGQGTVLLRNRGTAGSGFDWPIFDGSIDGPRLAGPNFLAQLYAAPVGSPTHALVPIGEPAPFGTGAAAGYFGVPGNPIRTITGVPATSNALVQVRVWTAASGATYEEAQIALAANPSGIHRIGSSKIFETSTGGEVSPGSPPLPPAGLVGGESFAISAITTNRELVVNGGFAFGRTHHWETVDQGIFGYGGDANGNGAIGLFGSISQVLPTVPGTTYLLSFNGAGFSFMGGGYHSTLRVTWGGTVIGDYRWHSGTPVQAIRLLVKADSTNTVLRFDGVERPTLYSVSVVPSAGERPTVNVSVTLPAEGAIEESFLAISAEATPGLGRTVQRVEFLANIEKNIASVSTPPYAATWTNLPPGQFYVTARAYGSDGLWTDSPGVLLNVKPRPKAVFSLPSDRQVFEPVFGNALLIANVSQNDGTISGLEFYLNGESLGIVHDSSRNGPHSLLVAPYSIGSHQATVVARNAQGKDVYTNSVVFHVMEPGVTDVEQLSSTASARLNTNRVLAQTIVAKTNGFLRQVALPVFPGSYEERHPMSVEVFDVADGRPGTNLLGTGFLAGEDLPSNDTAWRSLYFPSNRIAIHAGRPYALVFRTTSPFYGIAFSTDMFDPYADGMMWTVATNGAWAPAEQFDEPTPRLDLVFRTVVIPDKAPTVAWKNPAPGAFFRYGEPIPIELEAADPDQPDDSVVRIDLFANGEMIGSTTTSAASVVLDAAFPSTTLLEAQAIDSFGQRSARVPLEIRLEPLPALVPAVATVPSAQSGLFGQRIIVTNTTAVPLPGLRVWVTNAEPTTVLWNATGRSNGVSFVDVAGPLAPGATAALLLEFFSPTRSPIARPDVVVEAAQTAAPVLALGPILSIDRIEPVEQGVLLEFKSLAGAHYQIQYSHDSTTWKAAAPSIAGTGTKVQWIDQGPPKTDSAPSAEGVRLYRLVQLP